MNEKYPKNQSNKFIKYTIEANNIKYSTIMNHNKLYIDNGEQKIDQLYLQKRIIKITQFKYILQQKTPAKDLDQNMQITTRNIIQHKGIHLKYNSNIFLVCKDWE